MIVEQRTYTLKAGTTGAYLKLYRERGYDVQTAHLGHPIGYYTSEIGELNQIIHMWAYDTYEERVKRRAALYADEKWLSVVGELLPLIVRMESRILVPTDFSPRLG